MAIEFIDNPKSLTANTLARAADVNLIVNTLFAGLRDLSKKIQLGEVWTPNLKMNSDIVIETTSANSITFKINGTSAFAIGTDGNITATGSIIVPSVIINTTLSVGTDMNVSGNITSATMMVSSLIANRAVVTDGSKNLISKILTSSGTPNSIVVTDANGDFYGRNITATGSFSGNIIGNASTVTNGVYTIGDQTIGGSKTFSSDIVVGSVYVGAAGTDYSVRIGHIALVSNTSGDVNTAIGASALHDNTTGTFNTAIGGYALRYVTTGEFNTAIGVNSLGKNVSGDNNVGVGYLSLYNTVGNENTAIGVDSGSNLTSGSNNIAIGASAYFSSSSASNQVRIGNTAITSANIQVAWTITSDKKYKKNIKPCNLGINFIKELKPVQYVRRGNKDKKLEYGFIAQDIQKILKKFDIEKAGLINHNEGYDCLELRYNDLFAILVKAIQEQQHEIDFLKNKIGEK